MARWRHAHCGLSRMLGGRKPLSCDHLDERTCVRGQRGEVKHPTPPCSAHLLAWWHWSWGLGLVLGDLKRCSVLTPDRYRARSLRPPSCCSLWRFYRVSHLQALVHACTWEAFGQFSALRVSRRGIAWRLQRPHQLIYWYILHGHFTAVTSVLVTVVYNWIDLISDQFVGLPPADCYLYLDALMLEKKMLVLMLINVGFCT